ncbi:hypothetical protein V5O48_016055 [Marasmius crinis-equi]|uniref:Uncharacterized protein n=1 Tax=Marasmius crinis-equi TaxID=585013 RepID=A0ABR3ESV3_9AGAR
MGPGHRRETIDDHIAAWCFWKLIGLEFTNGQQQADEWLDMIQKWESGESDVNPYATSSKVVTEQEVWLRYGEEELASLSSGKAFLHDVAPSAFMLFGLDLEEQQRVLLQDIKEQSFGTIYQQNKLVSRQAKIQRSIARFRTLQKVYTPTALSGIASTAISPTAETVSLLLTSALPPATRSLPEMQPWVKMEMDFRRAQCLSSLHGIRSQLFVQSRLHSQRSLHVRSQHSSTKSRRAIDRQERKTVDFKAKYRAAYLALLSLVGHRDQVGFKFLNDADITPLNNVDTDAVRNRRKKRKLNLKPNALIQLGESRRKLSWIWTGVDVLEDSVAMQEAMRVEWCKAYARKCRWWEELQLVEEEMRRTAVSLEHQAGCWEERVVTADASADAEAVNAYSHRQAELRRAQISG